MGSVEVARTYPAERVAATLSHHIFDHRLGALTERLQLSRDKDPKLISLTPEVDTRSVGDIVETGAQIILGSMGDLYTPGDRESINAKITTAAICKRSTEVRWAVARAA